MKSFRNLKHIALISSVALVLIFSLIGIFFTSFNDSINGLFIYRTGSGIWQDIFHKHSLSPILGSNEDERNSGHSKIIIVKVDDQSLDYFQSKGIAFDKAIYTKFLEKVELAGPKAIGFDILFQVPDFSGSTISGVTQEEEFANTLKKYSNVAIAAQYTGDYCSDMLNSILTFYKGINISSPETYPGSMDCFQRLAGIIGVNYTYLPISDQIKYKDFWQIYTQKEGNVTKFSFEDKRTLFCQKDGNGGTYESCLSVPRSLYKDISWGMINVNGPYSRPFSQNIASMPYASWKSVSGVLNQENSQLYTLPAIMYKIAGGNLPNFKEKNILQPYFGVQNEYSNISLMDVLNMSRVDAIKLFHDNYVLVGNTTVSGHDFMITPVTNEKMAGVESHAHFLDGLLQNKMLAKLDTNIAFFLIVLLTIFSVCVYFFLPRFLSPVVAILFLVLILWTTRYLYDRERLLVDIFPLFLAGSILTYPVTYIYKFFVVEKEKRELQGNFSHYVDPTVVKQIADNGEDISLGGERREMTVFFSDIAGFTTISEKVDPTTLFYLMTSYLSNMTDILIREGGTLDKYIGDAVMGFFGAPLPDPLHPIHACRTALLMRQALPDFNKDISAHGVDPIDFRVGIASGEALVGNIGSKDRFNYTVLGDTVNLASRLEGTGKEYAVHIIISEGTREKIGDEFLLRELDTIAVKGKTEGVRIFELLAFATEPLDMTVYKKYEEALSLYREGKYREAGELWALQMELDPPSRIMALRCVDILKGSIHVENGVYHMTHK